MTLTTLLAQYALENRISDRKVTIQLRKLTEAELEESIAWAEGQPDFQVVVGESSSFTTPHNTLGIVAGGVYFQATYNYFNPLPPHLERIIESYTYWETPSVRKTRPREEDL